MPVFGNFLFEKQVVRMKVPLSNLLVGGFSLSVNMHSDGTGRLWDSGGGL